MVRPAATVLILIACVFECSADFVFQPRPPSPPSSPPPPPPFAWSSPEWATTHARLVDLLHDQDYQGLHGVPLPEPAKLYSSGRPRGAGEGERPHALQRPYHLVITSCHRRHWIRHLMTTLLQIKLQKTQPATLTVMWCHPYNASAAQASLFYNLRYSHQFRLLHVPPESLSGIKVQASSTYWWALTVPDLYNQPELPLLVMEDDAVLHPHFARILMSAARAIEAQYGPPYMLNAYTPGDIGSASHLLDPQRYNATSRPVFANERLSATLRPPGVGAAAAADAPAAAAMGAPLYGHLMRGGGWENAWSFGVQAQLFSSDMRAEVMRHYWEMMTGAYSPKDTVVGFQDMILFNYVYLRRGDERRRSVFGVSPSLVEHTGATSSVFGGIKSNLRFHMSHDFPFHVGMPMLDAEDDW